MISPIGDFNGKNYKEIYAGLGNPKKSYQNPKFFNFSPPSPPPEANFVLSLNVSEHWSKICNHKYLNHPSRKNPKIEPASHNFKTPPEPPPPSKFILATLLLMRTILARIRSPYTIKINDAHSNSQQNRLILQTTKSFNRSLSLSQLPTNLTRQSSCHILHKHTHVSTTTLASFSLIRT